jgi:hypothetical protein
MAAIDQISAKRGAWKHVEEGEMPPGMYLLMHSEARLDANEKSLIQKWAEQSSPADADSTEVETTPTHEHE